MLAVSKTKPVSIAPPQVQAGQSPYVNAEEFVDNFEKLQIEQSPILCPDSPSPPLLPLIRATTTAIVNNAFIRDNNQHVAADNYENADGDDDYQNANRSGANNENANNGDNDHNDVDDYDGIRDEAKPDHIVKMRDQHNKILSEWNKQVEKLTREVNKLNKKLNNMIRDRDEVQSDLEAKLSAELVKYKSRKP
ncbi:unnamed protein product [Rotaria sp. Silwood2]|nr:unnamed protein product [Rotaria sp. Silwood2]CAF4391525.1 unnamed protein product [Rotaria sp. Silwood2]